MQKVEMGGRSAREGYLPSASLRAGSALFSPKASKNCEKIAAITH
ncbi:hypothetical protein [Ketogulonicigenium robustum]|nr:hypothetical protein [Ketogulonicigenium robustum]